MTNKNYEAPEVTVMHFLTKDVITTSGLNPSTEGSGSSDIDWGELFGD